MNLFSDSFELNFKPDIDNGASFKFILASLMYDRSLKRLLEILDPSLNIGSIEGEPGWELEKIEDADRELKGYADWPKWASFRAYVDPDFYELAFPEYYFDEIEFKERIHKAVKSYLEKYPEDRSDLAPLLLSVDNI